MADRCEEGHDQGPMGGQQVQAAVQFQITGLIAQEDPRFTHGHGQTVGLRLEAVEIGFIRRDRADQKMFDFGLIAGKESRFEDRFGQRRVDKDDAGDR